MINLSQTLNERLKYLASFFQKKYSHINTNSGIPSVLSNKTHKLLSTIYFTSDNILKIIEHLDPNKALGI